ncbi:hypothetical protein GCM10022281_11200 [Sphingomonas rosea]|jgi:hypothetical protein|uniref:Uncharacterized protein n=1 Tax=Sphingomonas rosea TaxID=335605 RepID=A0ABP7TYM4_9SPHN
MQEYRVYLLDRDDKIVWSSWIEAADVETAVVRVRNDYTCPCEIWDGARRVAVIGAQTADLA